MVWPRVIEAINDTKLWFQVQQDLGQVWIAEEAKRMGSDPTYATWGWPNRTSRSITNPALRRERS
jgi:hypothetical protein